MKTIQIYCSVTLLFGSFFVVKADLYGFPMTLVLCGICQLFHHLLLCGLEGCCTGLIQVLDGRFGLINAHGMGWNEWLLRCIGANGWAGMRQSEWLGVDTLA